MELRLREEIGLLEHPILCNIQHRILYKQRTKQTAPVTGSLRPQCDSRRSTEQNKNLVLSNELIKVELPP